MLEICDLSFRINDTKILNGVTFSVRPGEKVGIIGPNGSGKTTLFNCISGFNIPTKGKIIFRNREITHLPAHKRARLGLGRVFQNFGIFREMTVLENVLTALEGKGSVSLFPWGNGCRTYLQQANDYLDLVGLADRANEKAGSLSGGQLRLLEISRAIAFGAELFLLDEPTAGVSPKMKNEINLVLDKLLSLDRTLLIIEHDMNFIQRLCDRIIVLDVGKNVLDGTPEEIRSNRQLQEIYFGSANGSMRTPVSAAA